MGYVDIQYRRNKQAKKEDAMIEEHKEKLFNYTGKYISIGISETGEAYGRYPVPWDSTANAYNMKLPDVYLAKEDLHDESIVKKLEEFSVVGCYIFCALEDYSFLEKFPTLMDINIYEASNLTDLSFMKSIKECVLLFVSKAHFKNLDEIIVKKDHYYRTNPKNLALYDCVVDSIDTMIATNCLIHELIICNPKARNERKRWKKIRNAKYYDMKEN